MNSPRWHYVHAERLMERVASMQDPQLAISRALTAQALVHATLASASPGHVIGTESMTRAEREAHRDSVTAELTGGRL